MTIDQRLADLKNKIPLLNEWKPEGWVDFRDGYNRGVRLGVFQRASYDYQGMKASSSPSDFKAIFDTASDAQQAAAELEAAGIMTLVSDDGGLWSVLFVVEATS